MDKYFGRVARSLVVTLGLLPQVLLAAPDLALQMTVDPVVPTPGQPVEFTVIVSNKGASNADNVVVSDKLPPGLAIPAGMAAYPSTGTYDPSTGNWSVGSLAYGASATLVIPAIVVAIPQPTCSVNVAEVSVTGDTDPSNDRAVAAVKTNAADRCVDVRIVSSGGNVHDCGSSYELKYWVTVSNAGPDDARAVYLDLAQSPVIVPHLRFSSDGCDGLRCTFATLPAGASITVDAKSGAIDFDKTRYVHFDFAASSSDTDYATGNNQRTDSVTIPKTPDCDYYGEPDGSNYACFIATAAYGSPLEPHVVALRQFRDQHLKRTALGRAFIRVYYRYSPPVAAVIARHEPLRVLARMLLTPVVFAIEFPLRAGALASLLLALPFARRRKPRGAA
jgi:uncharacterized repeat protein (TIGR01451 family)